jgi:hypothetical protein
LLATCVTSTVPTVLLCGPVGADSSKISVRPERVHPSVHSGYWFCLEFNLELGFENSNLKAEL